MKWFAIVQADQEPESFLETGKSIEQLVGQKFFIVDIDANFAKNHDLR
jgi:hypothetical protein